MLSEGPNRTITLCSAKHVCMFASHHYRYSNRPNQKAVIFLDDTQRISWMLFYTGWLQQAERQYLSKRHWLYLHHERLTSPADGRGSRTASLFKGRAGLYRFLILQDVMRGHFKCYLYWLLYSTLSNVCYFNSRTYCYLHNRVTTHRWRQNLEE